MVTKACRVLAVPPPGLCVHRLTSPVVGHFTCSTGETLSPKELALLPGRTRAFTERRSQDSGAVWLGFIMASHQHPHSPALPLPPAPGCQRNMLVVGIEQEPDITRGQACANTRRRGRGWRLGIALYRNPGRLGAARWLQASDSHCPECPLPPSMRPGPQKGRRPIRGEPAAARWARSVVFFVSFLLAQLQQCKIDKSKLHIFKVDSWAFGGVSASWSRHQSQANERARHLPSLPLWRVPVVPGGEGTAVGRVNSLRCVLTVRSGE